MRSVPVQFDVIVLYAWHRQRSATNGIAKKILLRDEAAAAAAVTETNKRIDPTLTLNKDDGDDGEKQHQRQKGR